MSTSENHLSALALDAFDLGVLRGEDEARAKQHLAACERCRGELAAARAARAHFEREVLPRTLPEVLRRHRRQTASLRRRLIVALPVLAAAAALLLLSPRAMLARREEGIQVKGGAPSLKAFARRGNHVFPVSDGTVLAPGDDLRFVVQPAGRRYVLIASVDGAGGATVYYPYGGAASAPVEKSPRVELPGSIHLDAAPGPERVFALYSDQPIDAEAVLADLRALGASGADAIRARRALDGAGARAAAAQASVLFEKAVQ